MPLQKELKGDDPITVNPIYDVDKSYAENVVSGPRFDGPIPVYPQLPEDQWISFLGYKAASPLGIPAGPLLNSEWTTLAARLGFDIVTYKTIRSYAHSGHPLPNVLFVRPDPRDPKLMVASSKPEIKAEISITNSFGMPSMSPEFLQQDIAKARKQLSKGQLLIVSVMGTPNASRNIVQDFVYTACMAKEAGAHIIEANFSCPNVSSKEGSLYCDPSSSREIASLIASAIKPLPLMVKVGSFPNIQLMQKTFLEIARAGARGICGINTLPMRVVDNNNAPALGMGREMSGICGDFIRNKALEFTKNAAMVIRDQQLDLELSACGGIMKEIHFNDFLNCGAKVAMSATGMMWDPFLGIKWKQNNRKHQS